MKLDHFRDVVAIAECGGMRAASRHIRVAQPVLARNLRSLELEMGCALFKRTVRGMTLTSSGEVFVSGAKRVLKEVQDVSERVCRSQGLVDGETPVKARKRRLTLKDENRTDHVFIDVVLETFRLNGKLISYGDQLVKPINLTGSRWQVLGSLPRKLGTVSQIARYMGLQRQSVQRTIELLRREGLVELVDNPNHRRAKLAVLTSKGRAKVDEATEIRNVWIKRATVGVSNSEMETAYQVMRRIRRALGDRSVVGA